MNWKKFGVYSILIFVVLIPLISTLVFAFDVQTAASDSWKWFSEKITPVGAAAGAFTQGTAQVLGILAIVFMFVVFLDLSLLVLPFGKTTSWIIAVLFTIGVLVVDLIRTVAGWGLAIGSFIAGGAGVFAIIMSAVVMLAAVIALFFGGDWILNWFKKMKTNREGMEGIYQAKGRGMKIRGLGNMAEEAQKK